MSCLAAQHIRARCLEEPALIYPFHERQVREERTFGLGPAGYDIRIAENVTVWPGSFVLASAVERFSIPNDLRMKIEDKSTWIRKGLAVQNTVAEPGWRGYLTLELTNHHPWWKPWRRLNIAAGTPIAQVVFETLSAPTSQPYKGRYQDQPSGVQPARDARKGDR